jgi:fructoselysine-6-P-deglycase FrlB-like protein
LNSIDAMALDMERQVLDLPRLSMPAPAPNSVAFVGSGDSYVAGLAAHYLSSGLASCLHPADIISDPSIVRVRDVHFVSASGKTRANVLAAKAARKAGLRTVAVTMDASSPLAKACDDSIILNYRSAGKTSGTISFVASLIVCTWIATGGKVGCPASLEPIYRLASKQALQLSKRMDVGPAVFLGDSAFYLAAMYGALKFNEVFGTEAFAHPLEDFFHAPLFGTKKGRQILVLGSDGSPASRLKKAGMMPFHVRCKAGSIESLLYAAFFMQHLTLQLARRQGRKECYFMQDKELLKTSSDFIY